MGKRIATGAYQALRESLAPCLGLARLAPYRPAHPAVAQKCSAEEVRASASCATPAERRSAAARAVSI